MLDIDGIIDGKYHVVRLLGQGGMGAVYEGKNKATGRRVAIKVIRPSTQGNGILLYAEHATVRN
jgi:serine/threonine protein kinase